MNRVVAGGGVLVLGLLAAVLLFGGPGKAEAHHQCGDTGSPLGPFDLQAYEAKEYKNTYARALELAGFNQLFPELPSFTLPRVETGDRAADSDQTKDPYIPPVLLKAIAWIESGWAQADYTVPYGGVGSTLISHDCGYGIMQVTTGMQNISGVPSLDQAMIGGHYAFNIARGARILAGKWNQSPEYRPIVGGRDPALIEDWYFAIWSYNGFAFKNHPLNPDYQPGRPPFSCGPEDDGLGHDRGQYPYQELVLGCVAHPPIKGGAPLWEPQEAHLPDLSDPRFAEPLKVENWNACSYEAQCAPMDIPTPNTNHKDPTAVTVTRTQLLGTPLAVVSSDAIAFEALPGGESLAASVTIANHGSGVLAWRASASASWIKLSRGQGVSLGTDIGSVPSTVTITPDMSGLAPGTYTGQITIESLYAAGAPRTVQVSAANYPDGMLIMGSGPEVYVMNGGLRRHVPNPATFEALGLDWSAIVRIPDDDLSSLPAGNPLLDVLATGRLVRGTGPAVYAMDGDTRHHITGPEVLEACGYEWGSIVSLSDASLAAVPEGAAIAAPPCPLFAPRDGSLLLGSGPAVYLVRNGLNRHVPNLATFEALGLRWGNADRVTDRMLDAVPSGQPLLDITLNGTLLRGPGPEVYVMQGGAKRHVASPVTMSACGYGWDAVYTVSSGTLASIPSGSDLSAPPCPQFSPIHGTLMRGASFAIYVVGGSTKRHIVSPKVFLSCGYKWGNVSTIPDSVVAAIPTGAELTGVPCP